MSQFPICYALLRDGRYNHLVYAANALRVAASSLVPSISNADFVEYKGVVSRAVEEAWDLIRDGVENSDDYYVFLDCGLNRFRTKLVRLGHIEFATEIAQVVADLEFLKDKTVKRKKNTETAPNNNNNRVYSASCADVAASKALLEEVLAPLKDALRTNRIAYWRHIEALLQQFIHDPTISTTSLKYSSAEFKKVFKKEELFDAFRFLDECKKLNTDNELFINATVNSEVDDSFASFIAKQTAKLSPIVKDRGISFTLSRLHGPGPSGDLGVRLSDGASFCMRFQFVWVENQRGNRFHRFPTTFHEAKKADGTCIRNPSAASLAELL